MASNNDFFTSSGETVASCSVGDTLKIYRPLGYKGIKFIVENTDSEKQRFGFSILYPNLGKFVGDSGDESTSASWVLYKHEKSGRQIIRFISNELGYNVFTLVVQGIPVHDHASIAMGGPAFGTYFTELSYAKPEGT